MWREILKMAFGALQANKLRAFLTMAGITIGVFSVIGVMTTVTALRASIETGLSFLGSDVFQITKYPVGITVNDGSRHKFRNRPNLTLRQGQRYRELMRGASGAICLQADYRGVAQATSGQRRTEPGVSFTGTDENFLTTNQYAVATGRNFTGADVALAQPVMLIGHDLVEKLFPSSSPLGRDVNLGGRTYRVIGTLAAKGTAFGQSQDNLALIPITRFMLDFGSDRYSITIATQAVSQLAYNPTMDRAITVMRLVRGLPPERENDFSMSSNDSLIAAFGKIANAVGAGSLVISGIALLAAGVGIMNIMLVSVTERTREIGVRKSIGARKSSILAQFLLEAVVLSLAGGLAGILLGVAAGNGLALLMKASLIFPWGWAAAGVLVCSAIGVSFGFYPAWKAASLDPIEALRYE